MTANCLWMNGCVFVELHQDPLSLLVTARALLVLLSFQTQLRHRKGAPTPKHYAL